jgi:arylsulfatase
MAERPNIVFILLDNVGWGDFGCYGGMTPTPRIDKFPSKASASAAIT